ncbi:hypothetical protein NS331_10155 [Pseudacidovorax intermedius]|uniref:Uncharacterized protein n=1 Tax=Pseudacidovorax intermedius TaxID=433924 RepID=A0A147GX56_9BURK|nr:hypothetical protein NS331_10155 [Pseudacidovorax intermedius]
MLKPGESVETNIGAIEFGLSFGQRLNRAFLHLSVFEVYAETDAVVYDFQFFDAAVGNVETLDGVAFESKMA